MNDQPDAATKFKASELVGLLADKAADAEDWLEKIREDKSIKPADMAKMYYAMDTFYDEIKAQLTRIYNVVNAVDKAIFPALLEHHGLDMVRVPELKRSFSVKQMTSASMIDKEGGITWLREQGHGDLIQETVNAGTLASFFRNMMLEQGIDPPEEFFKINSYRTMTSAKYTPKPGAVNE